MTTLPRPGPLDTLDGPGTELDLLWAQLCDLAEATDLASSTHIAASAPHSGHATPSDLAAAISTHESESNPHPQYPIASRVTSLEAFTASLAGAFSYVQTITAASTTTTLAIPSPSTLARDLVFQGWGEKCSPAGAVFNAIKVRTVQRIAALVTSRWKTLNVVVRTGANCDLAGSSVVAVGSMQVNEASDTLNDVTILLKDPSTGAVKTLSDSSFTGGEYLICIYALNATGGPASCGEPRGTLSNTLSQSYYFNSTSGNPLTARWSLVTGSSARIGFDHLYLVSPQENSVYSGPSVSLATSLADMAYPVPEVVLPPYIFAVEGRECNVYFDNLHVSSPVDFNHDVTTTSSVGKQQAERFTWIPAAALTVGTITVDVYHPRSGVKVSTKTAQLRAAAASAGSGVTRNLIVVGDSLVAAGIITQTLLDISSTDVMHVTCLGTQGTGPNNHEGRSGWTINQYVTSGSPFYISGSVNFPQYLTNNSIDVPDWVLVALGINDCFSQTNDAACSALADTELAKFDTLITSIKAAGAGVKVGVVIPSPPSFFADAFGNDYATGQNRWRFKRNVLIWARQLVAKYTGQEASRIYLIPSNTALDTVNNMSVASSAPANSRSSVNVVRQNNGVHPGTPGYQQIADAIWAFIKVQG